MAISGRDDYSDRLHDDPGLYFDNEKIARPGDTYSYVHRDMEFSELGLDMVFTRFYGKHSLWKISNPEQEKLILDIEMDFGRKELLKLCLVSPSGQVVEIAAGPGKVRRRIFLSPGTRYIVLAGYRCSGELSVKMELPESSGRMVIEALE